MAYYERLPTRLNPLAEKTCFSQINNPPNEPGEVPAPGPAADAALRAGWLRGRRHPLTHAPMGTLKVELDLDVKVILTPPCIFH